MKNVSSLARSSKKAANVIVPLRSRRLALEHIGAYLLKAFIQARRNNKRVFVSHYGYVGYGPTVTDLRSAGAMFHVLGRALDTRARQHGAPRSNGRMPANADTPWTAECWSRNGLTSKEVDAQHREEIAACLRPLRLGRILQRKMVQAIMSYT